MKRTATWIIAGAVVVLGLIIAFNGQRNPGPSLDKEPTVKLTDKQTGQVKTMPIETYIQGVVAGEMGQLPSAGGQKTDWPKEAYAAQAILARSFAMTFLDKSGAINISNKVEEAQAYAPENITPAIKDAVSETRGKVMVNGGKFVKAWFHSYSGGRTATAKEGLNYQKSEPDFIESRDVPANKFVPAKDKSWSASIPLGDVTKALQKLGVNVGSVTGLQIGSRGPSGRATELKVNGSGGGGSVHAADFRVAVGPERMKSTLVSGMKVENGKLVVSGSGFGHGVGLSQWDAFMMAKEGKSAEEILGYFFKNVDVRKAWK